MGGPPTRGKWMPDQRCAAHSCRGEALPHPTVPQARQTRWHPTVGVDDPGEALPTAPALDSRSSRAGGSGSACPRGDGVPGARRSLRRWCAASWDQLRPWEAVRCLPGGGEAWSPLRRGRPPRHASDWSGAQDRCRAGRSPGRAARRCGSLIGPRAGVGVLRAQHRLANGDPRTVLITHPAESHAFVGTNLHDRPDMIIFFSFSCLRFRRMPVGHCLSESGRSETEGYHAAPAVWW